MRIVQVRHLKLQSIYHWIKALKWKLQKVDRREQKVIGIFKARIWVSKITTTVGA